MSREFFRWVWICSGCGEECEPEDSYSGCCNEPAREERKQS
jgi:hypothetical protein